MKRFVEGEDRRQATLLPDSLEDYVTEDNPVRVVDVFIDELDLEALGFSGVVPEMTGRPAYHPATLLKIYLYGYLNRIQSSRRLERETQRNIELMWLTGRLMPDFKTIADFRRDSGPAIRAACAQFVVLCRQFNLFTRTIVAIDGSKFKAVNNRDKNFTVAKIAKRIEQVEVSIARYLAVLDRADREDGDMAEAKTIRLKKKIEGLRRQMQSLREIGKQVEAAPDKQVSLTDPDARSMATSGKGTGIVGYNVQIAVDAERHLIVAHDVTNVGGDRAQLTAMSRKAREASGWEEVTVLADRGSRVCEKVGKGYERHQPSAAGKRTVLKAAARDSIGPSIARRSMLDPSCTPWHPVWRSICDACSGSTIAAPCASKMTSGFEARATSKCALLRAAVSSIWAAPPSPVAPPLVMPAWKMKTSGCASSMSLFVSS